MGGFSPIGLLFSLGFLLRIAKVAQIIGPPFSKGTSYALLLTKNRLFLAILSQTHLVTLPSLYL
jgi:hypothetical protein